MTDISPPEVIFFAALEKRDSAERAAYLDQACAGDADLRAGVERLLAAQRQLGSFLESPAASPVTPAADASPDTGSTLPPVPPTGDYRGPLEDVGAVIAGRYKLLQKLGEGGMGAVFMAEQTEPVRRRVAVKLIKAGMDSAHVLARFEAERQALALMDHPNIAKVLDAGATGAGRPYFVMELVKGIPITKYCDQERLTPRERLQLFIPVCQAVQHAHQKGIIHRDLKPSNVLIALYDGRPVPKVIDFGVAKATGQRLTERTMFTEIGQIVGTLEYMSPEQAELNQLDVDTRSDIYSLGVLLYELLTGGPPFTSKQLRSAGFAVMLAMIRETEPPKPSTKLSKSDELPSIAAKRKLEPKRLAKLVRGDLDWIVMKCLEKERARRYESANGLAQDIERYLADEPVRAGPPGARYRLRKFVHRNRPAVAGSAAFVLVLIAAAVVSAWQAVVATRAKRTALEERGTAIEARNAEAAANAQAQKSARAEAAAHALAASRRVEAERQRDAFHRSLYAAQMYLVHRAWDDAQIGRAIDILQRSRPKQGEDDLRGFEWYYLDRLCHLDLATLKGHTDRVCSVVFSPDGKLLASTSDDNTVKIWSASNYRELLTIRGRFSHIFQAAFSPDGKRLAGGTFENTVKVWDVGSGRELLTLTGHTGRVTSVAFSPGGERLASGAVDKTVRVWDVGSGRSLLTVQDGSASCTRVAFSPDGTRIAHNSLDHTIRIRSAATGEIFLNLVGHVRESFGISFSPDGRRLASGSSDRTAKVWDTASGRQLRTLKGHTDAIWGVAFSPDGQRVATAGDTTVRVWDVQSGNEVFVLKGHHADVKSVAFNADGTRLASASADKTVKIWDAASGREVLTLKSRQKALPTGVAFTRDGKWVATGSLDKTENYIWDTASGDELFILRARTKVSRVFAFYCVSGVAFDPEGERLATASIDNSVTVWDTGTRREILTLKGTAKGRTLQTTGVAFSPDGKRLVSASDDGTVRIWDARTGQGILVFTAHTGGVSGLAFSPDGKRVATASTDDTAGVWDAATGKKVVSLKGHTGWVWGVAFSPDGKSVATASDDKTVRLWDAGSGKELLTLTGHTDAVTGVAFSPDGKRVASSSDDRTVKLWDPVSGNELLTLKGHTDRVWGVAFSPDGRSVASASLDGMVKVWEALPLTRDRGRQPEPPH